MGKKALQLEDYEKRGILYRARSGETLASICKDMDISITRLNRHRKEFPVFNTDCYGSIRVGMREAPDTVEDYLRRNGLLDE